MRERDELRKSGNGRLTVSPGLRAMRKLFESLCALNLSTGSRPIFLTLKPTLRNWSKTSARSNVRIHFDTFHANIEEQHPAASLRAIAKVLGHVHISENDRGIPGTGHNDWRGILLTLNQIGYDGWLTIESFARPEPDLAAAAAIWRDIAPSGDELAKRGIKFIKRLAKELETENGREPVVRQRKAVSGKKKSASRK